MCMKAKKICFCFSVFDGGGRRDLHQVAVQRAVHLADAVAGHRRPVRVDRAHGHRVGRLRLEQAAAALLELRRRSPGGSGSNVIFSERMRRSSPSAKRSCATATGSTSRAP